MHQRKKTIGQYEYLVYGVNADLINWAEYSPLAAQALGKAKVSIDDLFRAFGSRTDAERVNFSKIVIEKLWYSHPVLGPYPFLNTLSEFEFERVFYPNYRDHVCHQLKVYLLGLFAYDKCSKIRDELDYSLNIPGRKSEDEVLFRWLVTAVYHDIGYVIENDQAVQSSGAAWKKTKDELNRVLEAPLSTMPEFSRSITREVELRLIQDYQIFTPKVQYVKDIELYNKIDLLEQLSADALRAGLASNGSPLRAYYDYALTHDAFDPNAPTGRGRARFRDHGIASALLLLRTWRAFNDYVSRLSSKAGRDVLIQQNFAKIDELAKNLTAHNESILAAASAMALHNINGNLWDHGEALSCGLTLHRFRICLSEPGQQTPLAFLLGLVDSLQDWDRPRFRPTRANDNPLVVDQDISITSSGGKLLIHMPLDAEEFRDPASVATSRFSKAKKVMKEYLQDDAVDDLVEWTSSPQSTVFIPDVSMPNDTSKPSSTPSVNAILDKLPQSYQSYGKSNLFTAGTALVLDAKHRVILVAKTPIPIVGPRPYDGSSEPPYYEREQYDVYANLIERSAKAHDLEFICIASLPALQVDIANVVDSQRATFRDRIRHNLERIFAAEALPGSRCQFRWAPENLLTTVLITDENFLLWLKDDKGESVCFTAKSPLVADALAYQAIELSNHVSMDEVLSFI